MNICRQLDCLPAMREIKIRCLLERKEYGWTVEVEAIHPDEALGAMENRTYYAYVCTKGIRHVVPDTGGYRSLA